MGATVEKRAAVLLTALIEQRGTTPAEIASELGIETSAVERLAAGREPLELSRLERVLRALDADPAEFFGRLYAPGSDVAHDEPDPGTAEGSDRPISRHEVEEVLARLRSMIEGMTRMLDAEREAGRSHDDEEG